MNDLLVRAARGERTERPPVWLMRQAGRHLPEYRELRERYSFRERISTPEIAADITLQPWERYRPDGLVIFSDILPALEPLGFDWHIEEGIGPVVENPVEDPADVERPRTDVRTELDYVGDALELVGERVGGQVPLIGFAGGPFTLASYAIAGGSTRSHMPARRFRAENPDAFRTLLDEIASVVREHLAFQIESGAAVVQLFDTYASALSPADYRDFVLPAHRRILDGIDAPTIVFVKNMGGRLDQLAETGADVVSLDWGVDVADAREELGDTPVQGNLDPSVLFADETTIEERTRAVIDAAGPSGHVLNLGHGVDRDTPISGVRTFVETAKSIDR